MDLCGATEVSVVVYSASVVISASERSTVYRCRYESERRSVEYNEREVGKKTFFSLAAGYGCGVRRG